MDKQVILVEVKDILSGRIKDLNYQNIEEYEGDIIQFLNYLKATKALPIDDVKPTNEVEEKETEQIKTNDLQNEVEELNKEDRLYTFERKVKGGIVIGLDGGYGIPEKMVRDMGVGHLDKLKISKVIEGEDRDQYWFEIVERANIQQTNRQEYKFCTVKKQAGEFIVDSHIGGMIKLDEAAYSFVIENNYALNLGLQEGDIVDIAFYKDNPIQTMRVVFKHQSEYEEKETVEQKRLGYTTKKSLVETMEKEVIVDAELFENKKILIVGGISRTTEYVEALEKLGAIVEHASGDEDKKRLKALISSHDVVALTTGECSHDASTYTISTCKEKKVDFNSTNRNGIQSLLLCAEAALKKRQQKVAS